MSKIKEFKNKTKKKLADWKKWCDLKRYARRYVIIERNGEIFETKRDIYLKDDRVITVSDVVKVIITKRGKTWNKNMRILSNNGTYVIVYLSEVKYIHTHVVGDIVR